LNCKTSKILTKQGKCEPVSADELTEEKKIYMVGF